MKDGKKETFKIIIVILILSAHFYISFSFTCSMSNKEIYVFCCLVKYLLLILTKRLINQIKLKNQNTILDLKYHRCGKENCESAECIPKNAHPTDFTVGIFKEPVHNFKGVQLCFYTL